jgi:hypothetical protein
MTDVAPLNTLHDSIPIPDGREQNVDMVIQAYYWVASANLVDDSEALEELAYIRLCRAEGYVDQIDYSGSVSVIMGTSRTSLWLSDMSQDR